MDLRYVKLHCPADCWLHAVHKILVCRHIFYISTITSISVSVMMGAVPFILFAFGILLILGNTVTFLSVLWRINLHGIAMIIAFIAGLFFEPHYTQLPGKKISAENTFGTDHNRN